MKSSDNDNDDCVDGWSSNSSTSMTGALSTKMEYHYPQEQSDGSPFIHRSSLYSSNSSNSLSSLSSSSSSIHSIKRKPRNFFAVGIFLPILILATWLTLRQIQNDVVVVVAETNVTFSNSRGQQSGENDQHQLPSLFLRGRMQHQQQQHQEEEKEKQKHQQDFGINRIETIYSVVPFISIDNSKTNDIGNINDNNINNINNNNNSRMTFTAKQTATSTAKNSTKISKYQNTTLDFKIHLKSGQRDPILIEYSSRTDVQDLDNQYYVCYENWGDTIEATIVVPTKTTKTTTKANTTATTTNTTNDTTRSTIHNTTNRTMRFVLIDQINGTVLENRTDTGPRFFLYGDETYKNNNTSIINGKTLAVGKYKVIASVEPYKNNNKSISTEIINRSINFEVVYCAYFRPLNECILCPTTCAGGRCISDGYIRFTLVYKGDELWDYGMIVSTPPIVVGTKVLPNNNNSNYNDNNNNISTSTTNNTKTKKKKKTTKKKIVEIGAYYNGIGLPKNVVVNDTITGGYVDEDYKIGSCRSTGVWVKNIVFPSSTKTPKGVYTISLEDVESCTFGIQPPPPSSNNTTNPPRKPMYEKQFELFVYQNNKLKHIFTNNDGKKFTYKVQ